MRREFLTGQLLATFLDLLTLAVLLSFLFWLNAPLVWIALLCAAAISRRITRTALTLGGAHGIFKSSQ